MSLVRDHLAPNPVDMTPPSPQPQDIALNAVREGSEPGRVFWLMNALSAVIACYGLFANSPAVVIGAMVVAMLLGSIAGVALGLNEGDRPLLWRALFSLTGGILWIIAIAVAIGLIHRDVPLTDEILARTDPGLFDLMIALAGGAAGAVAVLSPRVNTSIVGVAVATALVPPLAAAGILLARAEFALAGGALLLALANVVAIQGGILGGVLDRRISAPDFDRRSEPPRLPASRGVRPRFRVPIGDRVRATAPLRRLVVAL